MVSKGAHQLKSSTSSRQADAINTGAEALTKGSKVWLRGKGESAWEQGELRSVDNGIAQVVLDKGNRNVSVHLNELVPANPRLQEGIADLTHLSYLNEPGILYNLHFRYAQDDIYTFAGPVLIAVNPCKALPLYTPEVANAYKAGARDVVHSANMAPHIYLVAANAFRRMLREKTSQSLIVNGESGAGKTETTKKAMQYFATLAGGTGVEDQVLETNPILEAFGNAKTLRNHNSSRFGKLIQIHFNQGHHICGAAIKTYLLEKSRVVHQLKGERSYHIFYQLVRGASKGQKAELHLPDNPTGFKFLASSGCTDIEGVNDAQEFKDVCRALSDIGITQEQQASLWRLLSGVLWLGNLKFKEDPADAGNDATLVVRDAACAACCDLLGVTPDQLQEALTRKRIITPGEVIVKLLNNEESRDCRDALAKSLYAATFDWIVARINAKLDTGKSRGSGLSIAILDIYGFEQFQKNSFEQLCINYANERLQQQFTRHLFTLEQQEYESEGIDWTKVEFIDNQECVDAIEATPPKLLGVLAVLDAQCKFPKATDDTFVHKLKEALSSHSHFDVNPRNPHDFTIMHYAGAVSYSSSGFLDKNKDTLNSDLVDLMLASNPEISPLVSQLGQAVKEETEANARRGGQTVGSRFSQQLRELIAELDATGLHFVRCIKPNASLKPHKWEEGMALHQLKCCGVLEVARIARAGYPTRYTHQAFAERYAILLPREEQAALLATAGVTKARGSMSGAMAALEGESSPGALAACQKLLDMFRLNPDQYQIGRTKVFFRPGVLGFVEDKWAAMQSSSVKIQAAFRMYRARASFLNLRAAAVRFQSSWRTILEKIAYDRLKIQTRAARVIQNRWRGYSARQKFLKMQSSAMRIQMAWRKSKFGKKVKRRVFDREKKEMMARLEQDKFESVRNQYGCDMEDVRAALAAWAAAKSATEGQDGTRDLESVMAEAQAAKKPIKTLEADTTTVEGDQADGDAPRDQQGALCRNCRKQLGEDEQPDNKTGAGVGTLAAVGVGAAGLTAAAAAAIAAGLPNAPAPVAVSRSATLSPRISHDPTMSGAPGAFSQGTTPSAAVGSPGAFGMAAPVAGARFTAQGIQEAKEAHEKLQLENMRLAKQLQLERSLKDRYQHKYEEQNGLWVEQIQVLQQYIQQVRTAFGDARLPPLPSALATATAPTPGVHPIEGRNTGSEGGVIEKLRSFGAPVHVGGEHSTSPPQTPSDLSPEANGTRDLNRSVSAAGPAVYTTHGGETDDEGDLERSGSGPAQNGKRSSRPQIELEIPPEQAYPEDAIVSPSRPVVPLTGRSTASRATDGGLVRSQAVTINRPAGGPAAKYVSQLDGELAKVQQVLAEDLGFIEEVHGNPAVAPAMDPASELNRLKKKFDLWRKEYKERLETAEGVIRKINSMQASGGHRPGGSGGHMARQGSSSPAVPTSVNGHSSHAVVVGKDSGKSSGFMGKLFKKG